MSSLHEEMLASANETDTFTFTIENPDPNPKATLSAQAIDEVGDHMKTWIAARLLAQWDKVGTAPKFVTIDVKVGVE
jgi:hypothetical protein